MWEMTGEKKQEKQKEGFLYSKKKDVITAF
jgi:hypothetical protein